jgi:hypothetical protein
MVPGILCVYKMYNGEHRLFWPMFNLSVLISAISIASVGIKHGQVNLKENDLAGFESRQFPRNFSVHVGGPTALALAGTEPECLDVYLGKVENWRNDVPYVSNGFANACLYAINPIFVEYFEVYKPWLVEKISVDPYQWPSPWTFAWLVRNSIVHNRGQIAWDKPGRQPIAWHNLTYSQSDNRRRIIGPDLTVADLAILLLEMNEALDPLGCPI